MNKTQMQVAAFNHQVAVRHFGKRVVRLLAEQGITVRGVRMSAVPLGCETYNVYDDETGTECVRTYAQILKMANVYAA